MNLQSCKCSDEAVFFEILLNKSNDTKKRFRDMKNNKENKISQWEFDNALQKHPVLVCP